MVTCLDTNVILSLRFQEPTAPLVAFTDDDCRPEPEWLERLVTTWDGGEEVLQGRTIPDPDESHLLHGLARTVSIDEPSEWFETCNIAYPEAFLRHAFAREWI